MLISMLIILIRIKLLLCNCYFAKLSTCVFVLNFSKFTYNKYSWDWNFTDCSIMIRFVLMCKMLAKILFIELSRVISIHLEHWINNESILTGRYFFVYSYNSAVSGCTVFSMRSVSPLAFRLGYHLILMTFNSLLNLRYFWS